MHGQSMNSFIGLWISWMLEENQPDDRDVYPRSIATMWTGFVAIPRGRPIISID